MIGIDVFLLLALCTVLAVLCGALWWNCCEWEAIAKRHQEQVERLMIERRWR